MWRRFELPALAPAKRWEGSGAESAMRWPQEMKEGGGFRTYVFATGTVQGLNRWVPLHDLPASIRNTNSYTLYHMIILDFKSRA